MPEIITIIKPTVPAEIQTKRFPSMSPKLYGNTSSLSCRCNDRDQIRNSPKYESKAVQHQLA
jgi:hypothetical protein